MRRKNKCEGKVTNHFWLLSIRKIGLFLKVWFDIWTLAWKTYFWSID